ncbi:MAG: hypothetical protein U1D26_02255 [Patescibacteria group bacterium]|nr:hypothetical protein [bacterium]MDZ4227279.1 hypothetical protein [Patescibacteria group bacterium]
MKTALLASYEKDEALLGFAKFLAAHGWQLLGSAGTAGFLKKNNVLCRDVAEIVGAPILGHRVVTLSRELHAALLSTDADQAELDKLGVPRIDLVYVTLYPLEKTIADPGATPEDVIEKTDIGGPTLIRSAAKGQRIAVSDPAQIAEVEEFIKAGEQSGKREALLNKLTAAAERRVSEYTAASAKYWARAAS